MKYINLFTAITLIVAGCGSSDSETQATQPTVTVSDTSTNPQTTNTVATPAVTPSTIPAPTVATTPGASTTISAATTNSALNPEHGKPGHRCDIAVGAPLNSKPTTPAVTTPATTTPTISTPVVTQNNSPLTTGSKTTTSTAAGMNPEHGKPGHRCDIAVGAPLDSKPIQATIQQPAVTTTPAPKAALPYTPVSTQPTANTPVAKGMNPAHGQPGHRCDISVGAPLDSKPATPTVATEATKPKQ